MPIRCLLLDLSGTGTDRGGVAGRHLDSPIDLPGVLAGEPNRRLTAGLLRRDDRAVGSTGHPQEAAFVLDPGRLGLSGDDPRLFAVAAAVAGCHRSEVVFVHDASSDAVAGAIAAGCRTVLVGSADAVRPVSGALPDAVIADLGELTPVLRGFEEAEATAAAEVGVGPHPLPWPTGDRFDPVLLATGDRRNVLDRYRYWNEQAIVADLEHRRHDFHVAVENWRHDRNIGAVVRNANAFGAKAVHVVGRRRWNKRGAMSTDRYLTVSHHDTVGEFVAWARSEGLVVVAVDNIEGARPLERFEFPRRCVLVFGQEGPGISEALVAAADGLVGITQYGSTRSINAGVASGIAMYAWVLQHALSRGVGSGSTP